tara:strand:+ start:1292 stop:2020 length:729 start_codon:yes stop_codon:yes gene_type:complete
MSEIEKLKIKIFADGADLNEIAQLNKKNFIKGFTTNPSLMRKVGIDDYKKFAIDVLKIVKEKPISFEVFSDQISEMEQQAKEIASWGKNIYVKIPITNSKGEKTINLIKNLSGNSIKCNVTAVLTLEQVKEVYDVLDTNTPSVISVFAGRIADTGIDPSLTIRESLNLCKSKQKVEILWASTREVLNIIQADNIGCHIITVPHSILHKLSGIGKNLKQVSLDTVQGFLKDSIKANYKIDIKK